LFYIGEKVGLGLLSKKNHYKHCLIIAVFSFIFHSNTAVGNSKQGCPKVIVLPDPFQSSQISDLIIRAWNQKFKGELPPCTIILDAKRSSRIISYFFETHSQALESLPYSQEKLDYLFKEFGITHIAIPSYSFSNGSIKTKTKIYSTALLGEGVPEIDLLEGVEIDIKDKNIKKPILMPKKVSFFLDTQN
jgi:hypothetical protein